MKWNGKKKETTWKPAEMMPLFGNARKDPKTNSTIPSDDDVKEAKDWVDFNQK